MLRRATVLLGFSNAAPRPKWKQTPRHNSNTRCPVKALNQNARVRLAHVVNTEIAMQARHHASALHRHGERLIAESEALHGSVNRRGDSNTRRPDQAALLAAARQVHQREDDVRRMKRQWRNDGKSLITGGFSRHLRGKR